MREREGDGERMGERERDRKIRVREKWEREKERMGEREREWVRDMLIAQKELERAHWNRSEGTRDGEILQTWRKTERMKGREM